VQAGSFALGGVGTTDKCAILLCCFVFMRAVALSIYQQFN
jgi:hypothetical protein